MRPQSFSGIIAANMNVAGPLPDSDAAGNALTADQFGGFLESGSLPLDLREAYAFGAAHIPGSVNVDFTGGPKLNWVGMAVAPDAPLALILPPGAEYDSICLELRRIGYGNINGWLKDGIHAWIESGRETQSLPYISAAALRTRLAGPNPPNILDVRSPDEFAGGHLEGAVNLTFDRIVTRDICLADMYAEAVIICQSDFRAGIAASMLMAMGYTRISVLIGGMDAWLA
jgi:hydroxyacylglutathione hydrolase